MRDMEQKGRGNQQKGEGCGKSKLSNAKVLEIRKLHASGHSYRKLASMFGMNFTTIGDIVNKHTWTHL